MIYLLDTNICIHLIRNKPKKVFDKFKRLEPGELAISSITMAELYYSLEKSRDKEKNEKALFNFLSLSLIL